MAALVLKKRKFQNLKKALLYSVLVLVGAITWIALFRINDHLALSEAWKIIFSLQGIFLSLIAIIAGLVSHILIGEKDRILEEALIAFFLILMAGLAEAWVMGQRPAFLPSLIMVVYLLTKIWSNYWEKIKFLKRAYHS